MSWSRAGIVAAHGFSPSPYLCLGFCSGSFLMASPWALFYMVDDPALQHLCVLWKFFWHLVLPSQLQSIPRVAVPGCPWTQTCQVQFRTPCKYRRNKQCFGICSGFPFYFTLLFPGLYPNIVVWYRVLGLHHDLEESCWPWIKSQLWLLRRTEGENLFFTLNPCLFPFLMHLS